MCQCARQAVSCRYVHWPLLHLMPRIVHETSGAMGSSRQPEQAFLCTVLKCSSKKGVKLLNNPFFLLGRYCKSKAWLAMYA